MGIPTPTTLDGFTPAWLTASLRSSGTIGAEASVDSVEFQILGTGEGFMGELARLTVGYAGGAGPETMIAKIPTQLAQNRALGKTLGIYEREVRVYADLVPDLPVPTPAVYAAIYEPNGDEAELTERAEKAEKLPIWALRLLLRRQSTDADVPPCALLLEDLAADAEVGDQVAGLSVSRIEAGLRGLARLHAATWNHAGVPDEHWVLNRGKTPKLGQAFYLNGRKQTRALLADRLSAHSLALLWDVKRSGVERIRRLYADAPLCLLHGDYRPDNLFFDDTGELVSMIDWQGANLGPAAFEVFYFLVSSLEVEDPDRLVDGLLGVYHDELVTNGVVDYPFERLRHHYAESLLVGIHGLPLLAANIDFGDGRGAELMARTGARLDGLLRRASL